MYYRAHWRRTFDSINALQACQNFSIDETLFPVLYSGLNWIQTVYQCKLKERERKRERDCVCPSFRENQSNQCIGGSTRKVIF